MAAQHGPRTKNRLSEGFVRNHLPARPQRLDQFIAGGYPIAGTAQRQQQLEHLARASAELAIHAEAEAGQIQFDASEAVTADVGGCGRVWYTGGGE
ncbi:MAG: hypothetical protein R3F10_04605 [Lysobacteraceae bacterium]